MIRILIFFALSFESILNITAQNELTNYQDKALAKINHIRRRYFKFDLKSNEKLQNSSQEYADSLAQSDIGLSITKNQYLQECGQLFKNYSSNETLKSLCGEILAMELNLDGNSIKSCNLEALIGMWESEEHFYNNERLQSNALYQNNLKSFSQIISNSTVYFGFGVAISPKKQRCYLVARFWPSSANKIKSFNSKRVMDIYLYNTWSGPQSRGFLHKTNVLILLILQIAIFFKEL